MTVANVSPVDAARLALTAPMVPSSPARDRNLLAAATLWCREMNVATIRRLSAVVGRSPSTVLGSFERVVDIYAEVIRREWSLLQTGWYCRPPIEAVGWLLQHSSSLAERDSVLLRLPALVHAAVAAAGATRPDPGRRDARRSLPLYVLAAFAEPDITLPPTSELRCLLVSVSADAGGVFDDIRQPA